MTLFQRDMYRAINKVAYSLPTFTNDDVFEQYEKDCPYEEQYPTEPNIDKRSYGSVVQSALKERIMEWTGRTIVSRRKNCHKMLIRVYKSNIYKKPTLWYRFKKWINYV